MSDDAGGKSGEASFDQKLEAALMRDRTAKFQLWQPLLAFLLSAAGVVLFAAAAVKGGENDAGTVAHAARAIADIPLKGHEVAYQTATRYHPRLAIKQRFKGEAGFHRYDGAPETDAIIALSRFDGDEKRGYVDIISMNDGSLLGRYRPDLKEIYARAKTPEKISHLRRDHSPSRYLPYHPLPFADGSLIFHSMDSPLVKMDACSRVVWMIDGKFHHGFERDGEGGLWAIRTMTPPTVEHVDDEFQDDAVVHVSAEGKVLFERSVAQALIRNGFGYIVYSHDQYDSDPVHLNDVQPAIVDGKYWKRGDLFLSLRNPSMIALYRPTTDEILWAKQGPWLMQHDVDIISDHVIGVFDNNAVASPKGEFVLGTNKILAFDFDTNEISAPFEKGLDNAGVRTKTNGLFRILSDGGAMIEEQNFGRLIGLSADGAMRWSYVNRAPKDGRVYHLGWSRALEGSRAAEFKRALSERKCGG